MPQKGSVGGDDRHASVLLDSVHRAHGTEAVAADKYEIDAFNRVAQPMVECSGVNVALARRQASRRRPDHADTVSFKPCRAHVSEGLREPWWVDQHHVLRIEVVDGSEQRLAGCHHWFAMSCGAESVDEFVVVAHITRRGKRQRIHIDRWWVQQLDRVIKWAGCCHELDGPHPDLIGGRLHRSDREAETARVDGDTWGSDG